MPTQEDLLTVKINKICHSEAFRNYYCDKFKYMPNGTTLDIWTEDNGKYGVALVSKMYGYDGNTTGFSEYDDLSDFICNNYDFTDEQFNYVMAYFRENYPDVYKMFKV